MPSTEAPLADVLEVVPGQRIQATVARHDPDGTVWIGWRGRLLPARSEVQLELGATYNFSVAAGSEGRVQLRAPKQQKGLPRLADALVAGFLGPPGEPMDEPESSTSRPAGSKRMDQGAGPNEGACWWCFCADDGSGTWIAVSGRWGGVRIDGAPDRLLVQIADPDQLPQAEAAIQATWPSTQLHIRPAPKSGIPYGDLLGRSSAGGSLLDLKV